MRLSKLSEPNRISLSGILDRKRCSSHPLAAIAGCLVNDWSKRDSTRLAVATCLGVGLIKQTNRHVNRRIRLHCLLACHRLKMIINGSHIYWRGLVAPPISARNFSRLSVAKANENSQRQSKWSIKHLSNQRKLSLQHRSKSFLKSRILPSGHVYSSAQYFSVPWWVSSSKMMIQYAAVDPLGCGLKNATHLRDNFLVKR